MPKKRWAYYAICSGVALNSGEHLATAVLRPDAEKKARELSKVHGESRVTVTMLARDPSEIVLTRFRNGKIIEKLSQDEAVQKTKPIK